MPVFHRKWGVLLSFRWRFAQGTFPAGEMLGSAWKGEETENIYDWGAELNLEFK
jgi:hypothetical protein